MFGPVPAKYRYIVWACGLVTFAGIGAWASSLLPAPTTVTAAVGLTVGSLVVVLFLHDFERAQTPAPVRPRQLPR